jgi:hypothetical protein
MKQIPGTAAGVHFLSILVHRRSQLLASAEGQIDVSDQLILVMGIISD